MKITNWIICFTENAKNSYLPKVKEMIEKEVIDYYTFPPKKSFHFQNGFV